MHGGRITTDVTFKTKREAQKFADDTNEQRHRANARVVKIRVKK